MQKGRGECKREECRGNEIKIPDTEDQCCWHCKDCGDDKIKISEYECKECEEGMRSVKNGNDTSYHCVLIEAVSILILGILVNILALISFLRIIFFNDVSKS